jgi:hypothetical protein
VCVFCIAVTELEYCSTAKLAYVALNALTRNRLPYGKLLPEKMPRVDAELARVDAELAPVDAVDAECAICRDVLTTPVELSCGHIFCDACLVDWLEVSASDNSINTKKQALSIFTTYLAFYFLKCYLLESEGLVVCDSLRGGRGLVRCVAA